VLAGSEVKMKQENVDYLKTDACIARANIVYQQQTLTSLRNETERIYFAAKTCVQMRNRLNEVARKEWGGEEEGLFQIMTAYMFLFKHLYVPQIKHMYVSQN